jgi:hypothetical protein
MRRLARVFLFAVVLFGFMAPPASAAPQNLPGLLGQLWTTALQAPAPANPFNPAGSTWNPCVKLRGNVVAAFGGPVVTTCTVRRGTKLLFPGWTTECDSFEGDGTTDAALRACATGTDAAITPSATLNGVPITLSSVETKLLHIQLPEDNIFAVLFPGRHFDLTGLSVAHGYLYLTHPLQPGTYKIVNDVSFGDGSTAQFTTVAIVR